MDLPKDYSDRLLLRLDPGCAFCTGTHPTTRLCLEALENNPAKNLRVVDLGCGSGILTIAALSFGAKEIWAVDIDPLAVRSTIENSSLNHLDRDQMRVKLGSVEALKSQTKTDPS